MGRVGCRGRPEPQRSRLFETATGFPGRPWKVLNARVVIERGERRRCHPKGAVIMIVVSQEDVLRGLKKFKRLAKQDMLAGPKTANPGFWTAQAEARRLVYGELTDWVEHLG